MTQGEGVTYCKRHPQTESNLRCSKCGDYICPRCLIQTPVGARCPSCADVRRNPLVYAPPMTLLKASVAGLAVGIGLSYALVYLVPFLGPLGFVLSIAGPIAVGYAVGEAVYRAAGYRRNTALAWIAAISVVAGLPILIFSFGGIGLYGLIGIFIGVVLAIERVRP